LANNGTLSQAVDHEEAVARLSTVSSSRWISFPLIFLVHDVNVNTVIFGESVCSKKNCRIHTFHALVFHRTKLSSAFPQMVWHANSLSGPKNSQVLAAVSYTDKCLAEVPKGNIRRKTQYLFVLGGCVWNPIAVPCLRQHRSRVVIVPVQTRSHKDRHISDISDPFETRQLSGVATNSTLILTTICR
jgi:hypothetical protein